MIDQVRRCFGHAPGVARGAHAATFAGIRDQEIVLALVAIEPIMGLLTMASCLSDTNDRTTIFSVANIYLSEPRFV